MSGCGGCGDSMHGHSPPQGPLSHGVGHGVGPGGAQQRFDGVGSGVGPGGAQHRNSASSASAQPENRCHCQHVDKLIQDMITVYGRTMRSPLLPTPLLPTHGAAGGTSEPYFPGTGNAGAYEKDHPNDSTTQLPLVLGFLGTSLASGRIFDDKISIHEDFQFNGHKNGHAWRSKTERYLITRVPALSQILRWAEREERIRSPSTV